MNIEMNGKEILRAEVIMADGNPYPIEARADLLPHHKLGDRVVKSLHLSATYHGDHDQFWVVVVGEGDTEIARFNARNETTGIIWV